MRYCSECGKETSEDALFCKACGSKLVETQDGQVNFLEEKIATVTIIGKNCPYCQTPIKPGAEIKECPACGIVHHLDCWIANGNKCTTFGCDGKDRVVVPDTASSPATNVNGSSSPQPVVAKNTGKGSNKWKKIAAAAIVVLVIAGGGVYAKFNTTDTVVLPDGSKYTGEIRWGKIAGNGTMYYSNSRIFKGQFQDGIPKGAGVMILTDGTRYEGNVVDGKCQGSGKIYDAKQQLVYDGAWYNDERNGQGMQVMLDGSQYIGMFANNKKNGEGKMQSKNGQAIYEGTWQNDEKHGNGKMWFNDGFRYEGQIKLGRRHGQGKLFNSENKLIFEGEWADDLKHGQGTQIAEDDSVLSGSWRYGSYVPLRVAQAPVTGPSSPQRRESPSQQQPQKRGEPTPQEVLGAFFNIINQFEKK